MGELATYWCLKVNSWRVFSLWISSRLVLRLFPHATSGNQVPVAASQQTRVVHVWLPAQSLCPYVGNHPGYRVIFHSSGLGSASIVLF